MEITIETDYSDPYLYHPTTNAISLLVDRGVDTPNDKNKVIGRWIFVDDGNKVKAYCLLDDGGYSIYLVEVYTSWNSEGFDWSDDNLNSLVPENPAYPYANGV